MYIIYFLVISLIVSFFLHFVSSEKDVLKKTIKSFITWIAGTIIFAIIMLFIN